MKITVLNNTPASSKQQALPHTDRALTTDRAFAELTPEVVARIDALPKGHSWSRKDTRFFMRLADSLGCSWWGLCIAFGRSGNDIGNARRKHGILSPESRAIPNDRSGKIGLQITAAIEGARAQFRATTKLPAHTTAALETSELAPQVPAPRKPVVTAVRCTILASVLAEPLALTISSKDDVARAVKLLEALL